MPLSTHSSKARAGRFSLFIIPICSALLLVPGALSGQAQRATPSRDGLKESFVNLAQGWPVAGPADPSPAQTTFVVSNTNDGGSGSLRQALLDANANPGADTINFNIPGPGVHTITPQSNLPEITDPVTIDGYTQPGASANTLATGDNRVLLIEISGAAVGSDQSGISIKAGNSTVRGLVVNRFRRLAIELLANGGNKIAGNFIGCDPAGTAGFSNNSGLGVNSPNNVIGGTTPQDRNVISGSSSNGVSIQNFGGGASGNIIQGNYIGLDATGGVALKNSGLGVFVFTPNNTIGGTAAGAGNVISGNGQDGVGIDGGAAGGNVIQGNLIGTDATGTKAVGNGFWGVDITESSNNQVGGTASGARNVISGNGSFIGGGVFVGQVTSVQPKGNVIQGNYIGTDVTGAAPLGNVGSGVNTQAAANTSVGGTAAGAGNVIAFNTRSGVRLSTGIFPPPPTTGNSVQGNSIFSNGNLGIDLDGDGVTANDNCDADAGTNLLQNFPTLTSAVSSGGTTTVQGTINSAANTTYRVEFFSSETCDSSGKGEGQTFLGAASVTTDGSCAGTISAQLAVSLPAGRVVTATATDQNGNTSEFSACTAATTTPGPSSVQFGSSTFGAGEHDGSVNISVTRTGDASGAAAVEYATANGTATDTSDYTAAYGTIRFAAGETSKSFTVFLTDDSFVEGPETIGLTLANATGAALGTSSSATLTITSDDTTAPSPENNPVNETTFFVRQHYHDFLNREPDAGGLAFWTNEVEQCGSNQQCREVKRINVSAAFFVSIEFQETGYLVYRFYAAAYGDLPGRPVPVRLREFLTDTQEISRGVQVNVGDWQQQLEANKRSFADEFVARAQFTSLYPAGMGAAEFVDALNANAGGALSQAERDALVNDLSSGAKTRAQVLRAVAEDSDLARTEFNRAFVLMQYFGYLRRNPDDLPDNDFSGWQFWLGKLNDFNGNYVQAEMVKAFISSDEYRQRFGQ